MQGGHHHRDTGAICLGTRAKKSSRFKKTHSRQRWKWKKEKMRRKRRKKRYLKKKARS